MATKDSAAVLRIVFLVVGVIFGYILIRAGVSSYDVIRDMFLMKSFHMYGVLGVAVITSFVGVQLWKRYGKSPLFAAQTEWKNEPLTKGHIWGGLIAGSGWALTGACPGPALAILGYGLWSGGFIVIGILAGTWLYALLEERKV